MENYIHRNIETFIQKGVAQFPALLLTGPRQSGKTTLLKHLFSSTHHYVSLDDPDKRRLAVDDPKLFLQNFQPPVIIDEIQNAPSLLPVIKMEIDSKRSQKGKFILTGSQHFPLMAGVSESLAGRIAVFTLLGFSLSEKTLFSKLKSIHDFSSHTLQGSFPEIAADTERDLSLWFNGYLQTYLERDVRQLRQVGDLTDFQRFLELLAARNGEILNLSNLANDTGVVVNTIKAWLSVLEANHQIVLVKPYFENRGKRIIKSPKCYFLDTGLLCHLCGITQTSQVFAGPGAGQRFETLILGELVRYYYHSGKMPRIFFWRTSEGEEVDFVVETPKRLLPVEIKLAGKANLKMAKGLVSFSNLFKEKVKYSLLIHFGYEKIKLLDNIFSLPVEKFISEMDTFLE